MIPYTPTPILFSIGPIAIRYYGLAYVLGFICAYIMLRRSKFREHADNFLLWIMIGVIVGGRVGEFIFFYPTVLWTDPLEILFIWHGGMSFHGGLIGSIIATWLYSRKHNLRFLEIADELMIPASIGIVLGRIANFLNGELYGTVTNVSWCITLPGVTGCRHPSPLYEALYTLVILVVLIGMKIYSSKKNKFFTAGTYFAIFIILYGLFRFIANFWRDDIRYLGVSTGQYLSLLTFVAGIWLLHTIFKKPQAPKKSNKKK